MARHGIGGVAASGAVLAVTATFVLYAAAATRSAPVGGAVFRAVFSSSYGIAPGAPVTVAGVAVGRVTAVGLDTATMSSTVTFTLRRGLALPSDSAFAIAGTGGVGAEDALVVTPGHAATPLSPGGLIRSTTSARSIEDAVGDYIFGAGIGSAR